MARLAEVIASGYDALERRWESWRTHRVLGVILVVLFLVSLFAIELNRRGWLPAPLSGYLTTYHFGAVDVAFSLLLVIEVLSLIFALSRSVADSMGKQFELLSLILLRKAFLSFGEFGEPIDWQLAADAIPGILVDIGSALLIFVFVGFYYRLQRHRPITTDERERASFIRSKKVVALVLLITFALLGGYYFFSAGGGYTNINRFFEMFYTVLIFSDVLIVLISLVYSSQYIVVFRNSGFAAATIIIRLALTAPPYVSAALGLSAVLFALAMAAAYNFFASEIGERQAI